MDGTPEVEMAVVDGKAVEVEEADIKRNQTGFSF
jgi:hypothetical protein